jgi:hypothetical protein
VSHVLITKACDWCKKEDKPFLIFFKPKGWIRHKTLDDIDMLFCSLACFRAFIGPATRPTQAKKPIEAQKERLLSAPAQ